MRRFVSLEQNESPQDRQDTVMPRPRLRPLRPAKFLTFGVG